MCVCVSVLVYVYVCLYVRVCTCVYVCVSICVCVSCSTARPSGSLLHYSWLGLYFKQLYKVDSKYYVFSIAFQSSAGSKEMLFAGKL